MEHAKLMRRNRTATQLLQLFFLRSLVTPRKSMCKRDMPRPHVLAKATLSAMFAVLLFSRTASAQQCNVLSMPKLIKACPGTIMPMPASLTGTNTVLSMNWTPAAGLSSTTVLNPTLTVPGTSGWYRLTVKTLVPVNLVSNGNFTSGNTGFSSAYSYVPNSNGALLPTSVYAICTNPHDNHSTASSFGDHTTGSGNMMAINGASTPVNVWCSSINVAPNTEYVFSAWFANWSSNTTGNLPAINFRINSALLNPTPFTFPTNTGLWSQFNSTWNSGTASGPVSICIYDQQTAASGNDFSIDDISFQQVCTLTDSVYVDVTCPSICNTVELPERIDLCAGELAALNPVVNGQDPVLDVRWTPATGLSNAAMLNPVLTGTSSGWYRVTVKSLVPGNLVTNGDFSSGNTGFSSSYSNVPVTTTALYPSGVYAICTNPRQVHTAAASFGDHTTGSGNMMAINGASAPVNVWCSTVNVTPNTDYVFSAWFANWSSDTVNNLPKITFKINGALLNQAPFTFPPTYGQWTRFYSTWNSGSTSGPVSICIYDQQTGAMGNDFVLDDISFQKTCVAEDSIYVNVKNCKRDCADKAYIKYVSTTDDNGDCVVTATAYVSSVYHILGYKWSGAGAPVTHYNHTGSDVYTFAVPNGNSVSLTCTVYIVDTTLSNPDGPCCQVELAEDIYCADAHKDVIAEEQRYELFPNPTSGRVNLRQTTPDADPVTAEVLDAEGKVVYSSKLTFQEGMQSIDTHLASGLYLLRLTGSKGKTNTLKFVVGRTK